jgi:hypothetical protein
MAEAAVVLELPLEEARMPEPPVDTGSPYSHEEWAAIRAALPRERERRHRAGLSFGQAEQSAFVAEVVRALRAAQEAR